MRLFAGSPVAPAKSSQSQKVNCNKITRIKPRRSRQQTRLGLSSFSMIILTNYVKIARFSSPFPSELRLARLGRLSDIIGGVFPHAPLNSLAHIWWILTNSIVWDLRTWYSNGQT